MKKLVTWICLIGCIFGLSACGGEGDWVSEQDLAAVPEEEQTYEQWKLDNAMQIAKDELIPLLSEYMKEETNQEIQDLTTEEIAYKISSEEGLEVDGYAFQTAAGSYQSAADSMGAVLSVKDAKAKIDGDQIIVNVDVTGEKKDAVAEVILSNDRFFVMESAALNPSSTMGELMVGAALNTLIGMGTVFAVLILISAIISCFRIIPKLQEKASARKKQEETPALAAAAQTQPEEPEAGEQSDDLELAAVIAAAVAAYEGSGSADGFVVRSIRRRR